MAKPTYVSDYKAIEDLLINFYAEGSKQAKSEVMKPAFNEVAEMYSVDADGKLTGGPIEQSLYAVVDEHFRPSTPDVAVAFIDISGTAAARVDSDNLSGFWFSDYFTLLKVEGKWTIINKIFHTHHAE